MLLARALAPFPRLLLLDEPLSNLDPYWVLKTIELLRETVQATSCAALVSLHDIDRVGDFDRVLLMDGGHIAADLAPQAMLASSELSRSFRIERNGAAWRVAPPVSALADPRSSR
jgi:iron complex transport system ATP-binding protein